MMAVEARDPRRLLAAVLERVEPQRDERGGAVAAGYAEHPAFFFKFIPIICVTQIRGIKRVCGGHDLGQRGNSESDEGIGAM